MRVPETRAGLNERSQSAYAAPIPKPVERAIGHVRPVACRVRMCGENKARHGLRKAITEATTPTLKPTPLCNSQIFVPATNAKQDSRLHQEIGHLRS